jgi:copper oxidase (laccase) domain-containing protein
MNVNAPTETDAEDDATEQAAMQLVDVRHLTSLQFAQLGVKQIAYVKHDMLPTLVH